jgi:hypothetical protein
MFTSTNVFTGISIVECFLYIYVCIPQQEQLQIQ